MLEHGQPTLFRGDLDTTKRRVRGQVVNNLLNLELRKECPLDRRGSVYAARQPQNQSSLSLNVCAPMLKQSSEPDILYLAEEELKCTIHYTAEVFSKSAAWRRSLR
jgi:hypothetical protein